MDWPREVPDKTFGIHFLLGAFADVRMQCSTKFRDFSKKTPSVLVYHEGDSGECDAKT